MNPDKIKLTPLETEKEMSGLEILQRHPAGKDYAPLLAGKEKFPAVRRERREGAAGDLKQSELDSVSEHLSETPFSLSLALI